MDHYGQTSSGYAQKRTEKLPTNGTNFLIKVHLFQKKISNRASAFILLSGMNWQFVYDVQGDLVVLRCQFIKNKVIMLILDLWSHSQQSSHRLRKFKKCWGRLSLLTTPLLLSAGWLSLEKFLCGLTKLGHLPWLIIKWMSKNKMNELSWNLKARFLNYSF